MGRSTHTAFWRSYRLLAGGVVEQMRDRRFAEHEKLRDMRLHLRTWGTLGARPLVCLHGITASGREFRRLAEERLAQRFFVLAPDLRGHGKSGWEPPWNIDTHVDDVLETLEREPATWIGHSFGCRLILELAARHPELLLRAVLLEPVVQISPEGAASDAELAFEDRSFASVEEAVADAARAYPRAPRELIEQEAPESLSRGATAAGDGGSHGLHTSPR
jgi:lipase